MSLICLCCCTQWMAAFTDAALRPHIASSPPASVSLLWHLDFSSFSPSIGARHDFSSAVKSYIHQSILYYDNILASSIHCHFIDVSLSPRSTANVWPSCSTLYYSAPCVSRRHQTCMPHMMHWGCLIIEMLNKYLQMADPSSPRQTHKCNLWSVSKSRKTAIVVPVWRLDIQHII